MPFFKSYRVPRLRRRMKSANGSDSVKSIDGELHISVEAQATTTLSSDAKKRRKAELDDFLRCHARYIQDKEGSSACNEEMDWETLKAPETLCLSQLREPDNQDILNKLAVLKFNGGRGTSMGLSGAKSALNVRNGQTFLDLTIQQILHLNRTHHVDIPLLLMNSTHTEPDTLRIVAKYANQGIRIICFNQSRYPRMYNDTLRPCSEELEGDFAQWYPPGHGDVYTSLQHSGLMEKLMKNGKEILFMSNADNFGATVDMRLLQYVIDTQTDFLMEVTPKTQTDTKGGILVNHLSSLKLMEWPHVPPEHVDDFQSVKKFGVFNTNSIWINLRALKEIEAKDDLQLLDLIADTSNSTPLGRSILELKTSAGSAIKLFHRSQGINVPRTRYLPVKDYSDLLLIKSTIYNLSEGVVSMNDTRMFSATPVIKLGDRFKNIEEFERRFAQIPDIMDLDHLTVAGDISFGKDVTLRGTVIIVAKEGERIHIPDGSLLENRLVSGNMISIDL